ncbi:MAG: PQQ-binding-like beta-propeller repeat protein [Pirellulales bacterium]|nr:PQQ-binding-like beta-propeller repeat protein [Pirellulales bacterium]
MDALYSCRCILLAAAALRLLTAAAVPAPAQVMGLGPESRFELDETVALDRADSQVAARIERAKALLADRQWDEAIGTLRQVMEESGEKLWPAGPRRFVPVANHAQQLLLEMPPEALALYRARVDPLAERWYRQGVKTHDRRLLVRVEREALASQWGDDALMALGEMALESGDAAAARFYWERVLPVAPPAEAPRGWLAAPDTQLDPAAVRARLVLASILEGSADRARQELAEMARLHPDARGRFGGREVIFIEALSELLRESAAWPAAARSGDWLTFAGSPRRDKTAPAAIDVAGVAWREPLVDGGQPSEPDPSPAEPAVSGRWWPFHPIRQGDLVLVGDGRRILALDLATGRPAWGGAPAVYRDPWEDLLPGHVRPTISVAQHTLTLHGRRLFARMGDAVTSHPPDDRPTEPGSYLVCLDLDAQGRLAWKASADDADWSFEGSPLCDGPTVYVAMRRGDIRPQAHVAALDAQTGRLLWRRFVCAAETPSRGLLSETTHNLLTLDHESLYYNTNLGAVAALDAEDGRIRWVSLYPRARTGDLAKPEPFRRRCPNPCIYHQGTLLVAPADSRRIFGLDAATGQFLWQTPDRVEDVLYLLGASGDHLIASGRRLYWIALDRDNQGKLAHVWPLGEPLRPSGRGLLAGDRVYWPAEGKVYVFDQHSAELEHVIDLAAKGADEGNLLAANGYLLIAGQRELIALGRMKEENTIGDTSNAGVPLASPVP